MSLNDTASSERIHIAFFGMRNAGKSSLVNAVTGQELAVVSEIKGTTTDPVKKAMELLPIGPVVIIDTPGFDDDGRLGELRVQKTRQVLAHTDIAVLVVDATKRLCVTDKEFITLFEEKNLPYVIAHNKVDLLDRQDIELVDSALQNEGDKASRNIGKNNEIYVSAATGENIYQLKEMIGALGKNAGNQKHIVSDLLSSGDVAVLVIPIDEAAPKGRLILPQQQTMRDLLDAHNIFITCQDTDLTETLTALQVKPKLVITDSQAFEHVAKDTPDDIMLTSFSILFARYKGNLNELVKGAARLSKLKTGDKVLISEGCTHHRQCNDIGTVKLPGWIEKYTGAKPEYTFTSGGDFPENLSDYDLIVHCGGCMLNEKEMQHRIAKAVDAGVPIVNYGVAIAQMHGILKRSLQPFPRVLELLK